MYRGLTPMLTCADVQASIAFYTDVLGFEVEARMDDVGKTGWASLVQERVHLMLASPTHDSPGVKVEGRFPQSVYYFYVDDIERLHERVRGKGGEPTEIVQRFYDQREFELLDPDGHVLVFGQHSPASEQVRKD